MTKINRIEITPEQKRKWIETRTAMLWACPAFSHILFSMLNPEGGELAAIFSKDVPIAATDGDNLILNPEGFFALKLQERVFVTAHEIMHCILNHCTLANQMRKSGEVRYANGDKRPYKQGTMNAAMDYVINDTLIQSNVGTFPTIGLHDPKIATAADSFLDTYKKIYEDDDAGKGGFDVLLEPGSGQGQDPGKAQQQRSQTEWDTAVAGALAVAKAQGKLPAALEKLFSELIDPAVSWQEYIRSWFARKVGNSSYDWKKPDRRLIQRDVFSPARSGYGCGHIVVGFDTSGSIYADPGLIDRFLSEVGGILSDLKPEQTTIVWCDAQVHRTDEVDQMSDLLGLKPVGGGGTSFVPVFDWVEQNAAQPDAVIYLTDGLGTFPAQAPSYPVLWGSILKDVKYPFGDVVLIPTDKK